MKRPNPLLSGLAGRCPNCGDGDLFDGFLKVAARCEACGHDLARADSGDGPAVFVILIAGFLLFVVPPMVEVAPRPLTKLAPPAANDAVTAAE